MAKAKQSEAESHFKRFAKMLKHIVSVPKAEIDKREAEWKKEWAKLKRKRKRK